MNIRSTRPFLLTAVLVGTAALSLGWAAQPCHESHQSDKSAAKGHESISDAARELHSDGNMPQGAWLRGLTQLEAPGHAR